MGMMPGNWKKTKKLFEAAEVLKPLSGVSVLYGECRVKQQERYLSSAH